MPLSAQPAGTNVSLIHLADYGGTYPGSFIPMLRSLLEHARERGWSVQAGFSAVAHDRGWLHELREQGLACSIAGDGRAAQRELVEQLCAQAHGTTILHSHFTAFDLAVAAAARRRERTIAYWHLHSALRPGPWWQMRNVAKLRVLSRGVSEMLCVAPNILEQARRRLAPRSRLALVPNAIDTARFALTTPARRMAARSALGLDGQEPVILHFGWDWRRKGGDLLLRAFADLLSEGKLANDSILLSAGAPPQAEQLARSLGIAENVRSLPPSDDVSELYAAADLFASPSRGEGHPFAVVEALASGLAVVASPIPGHRMIAEKSASCHIAPLEVRALADAIAAVLSEPAETRRRAGEAAHAWTVAEMDIGAWSERMLTRYERALTVSAL